MDWGSQMGSARHALLSSYPLLGTTPPLQTQPIPFTSRIPCRAASRPDVVIVDQVSVAIPLLRWLLRRPVLFYCHFPDLLLAAPTTRLHRFYRAPLDWLEQATTGTADLVVVNSRFTQGGYQERGL